MAVWGTYMLTDEMNETQVGKYLLKFIDYIC